MKRYDCSSKTITRLYVRRIRLIEMPLRSDWILELWHSSIKYFTIWCTFNTITHLETKLMLESNRLWLKIVLARHMSSAGLVVKTSPIDSLTVHFQIVILSRKWFGASFHVGSSTAKQVSSLIFHALAREIRSERCDRPGCRRHRDGLWPEFALGVWQHGRVPDFIFNSDGRQIWCIWGAWMHILMHLLFWY